MMYTNWMDNLIRSTGSLILWLIMVLAVIVLAGLIVIVAKAIIDGVRKMKEGKEDGSDQAR